MTTHSHRYISDGSTIYEQSFRIIRAEADLDRFSRDEENIAVRMIHAAGQTDLAGDIRFSPQAVHAGRRALRAGAPILTDVTMVATGVTRTRLPAHNRVVCTLRDPCVAQHAAELGTTRSAAAVDLWEPLLDGAVVAIGNAPTALYYLLDWLADDVTRPRPAVIVGIPVGFVGAAESKEELCARAESLGTQYITVVGRRGGSAITCAALNALACEQEIMRSTSTNK